jgi:hypothetical protein
MSIANFAIVVAASLMDEVDHYGALHVVVDDGNLEDGSLDFCVEYAEREDVGLTRAERALLALLRTMRMADREIAYEMQSRPKPWSIELAEDMRKESAE